jgi:hypothetical protein
VDDSDDEDLDAPRDPGGGAEKPAP